MKEKIVHKLEVAINKEIKKKNIENALDIARICSNMIYESNLAIKNNAIEESLKILSGELPFFPKLKDTDTVVFYDGFGLENRGLRDIYIKALCNIKKVVYITYKKKENNYFSIQRAVENHNGKVVFITSISLHEQLIELLKHIEEYSPSTIFYYSLPYDVVGACMMARIEGYITRCVINLTDHAYWVGYSFLDFCLEYRDYGASVSNIERGIPKEKIIKVPYYPIINNDEEFKGYPCELSKNKKVVFSGGSLYKTFSSDNLYYIAIDYMLNKYNDVVFWYAGSGNKNKLCELKDKYPGRVFITNERADLYQIMQNIYIYISTYPLSGGLMYQYAASAGKIPLTLSIGPISEGVLQNEEELNVIFRDYKSFIFALDYYMNNPNAVMEKSEELKKSVISETYFQEMILKIVDRQILPGEFNVINTKKLNNCVQITKATTTNLFRLLAKRNSSILIKYVPVSYTIGIILKIISSFNKAFFKVSWR